MLDELLSARGGKQAFSAVQLAVARTAARLLARDDIDPRDAGIVAELMKLLPPEHSEPPIDLTRLSGHQLDQLQRLVEIGHDQQPSPMTRRERSLRQRDADRLARLLDHAEKRGKLLDDERAETANLIHTLLQPLVAIPYSLWGVAPVAQPAASRSDSQRRTQYWAHRKRHLRSRKWPDPDISANGRSGMVPAKQRILGMQIPAIGVHEPCECASALRIKWAV